MDKCKLRSELTSIMERDGFSLRMLQDMTGVSTATLSRFIRDKGEPTLANLKRIEAFVTEILDEFRDEQVQTVNRIPSQATIERLDEGYLVCLWSQNCNRRVVRADIEDALADVSNFLLNIK